MSSLAKTMGKKLTKNVKLFFPVDMYNNCYGSVAVSWVILHKTDLATKKRLAARFKELAADPDNLIDFIWDDPEFVEKTCALFGLTCDKEFKDNLCRVKSKWNVLFTPYLFNPENPAFSRPLPLREDGFVGPTLVHGEVLYPLP